MALLSAAKLKKLSDDEKSTFIKNAAKELTKIKKEVYQSLGLEFDHEITANDMRMVLEYVVLQLNSYTRII